MEEEEVGDQGVAQRVASDSSSWQEEFRALFPNVNISFGGENFMFIHIICLSHDYHVTNSL